MNTITIEKLEGAHNWVNWKFQVGILLEAHGVKEYAEGKNKMPNVPSGEDSSLPEATAYTVALKNWKMMDSKAKLHITANMAPALLQLVTTCTTAFEMWEKLLSIYEQSSGQRLDLLYGQFFNYKMGSTDSIAMHVSRLQQLFNDLQVEMSKVKCKLPESMLLFRITSTLPDTYFEFKSAWESTLENDRTVLTLTERLRSMELRLQQRSQDLTVGNRSESVALMAKTGGNKGTSWKQNKKGENKSINKSQVECFKCKKKGHFKRDCPLRASYSSKGSDGIALIGERNTIKNTLKVDSETWVSDSGATNHMTYCKEYFVMFEKFAAAKEIKFGDKGVMVAHGSGRINVEMFVNGKWVQNYMEDVWYVPGLMRNLFSVRHAAKRGIDYLVSGDLCQLKKERSLIAVGKASSAELYELNMRVLIPKEPAQVHLVTTVNTLQLWHERLGHQNKRHVAKFLKQQGIHVQAEKDFCEGCVFGKQHRLSFRSRKERPNTPGELIHADVCGPMEVESLGGARYFVVFRDDFSRIRKVFILRKKSEVSDKLNEFLAMVKTAGHTVKEFLSDGGKEFDNAEVKEILAKYGIEHRLSMPYTPEQNGCAERDNRTLVEYSRSLLHAKGLPKHLWAEAVNTVVYVLNRTGPTSIEGKTPLELWTGKQPNVEHLKVFGTECYMHVPKQRRLKWDQKSWKGILVGYQGDKDGYRIYFPEHNVVKLSRDVIFKDEQLCSNLVANALTESGSAEEELDEDNVIAAPVADATVDEDNDKTLKRSGYGLRHKEQIRKPTRFDGYVMLAQVNNPKSYKEAIQSEEAEEWKEAMDEEMESLTENGTWELVEKPTDRKIIDNRWVLRKKLHPDGSTDRYKARLVAKGYSQKSGIDYDETFSPVARFDTIRTVLSVAASEKLQLAQFDVKTAFLYGELKEVIYMKQPEGYTDETDRVCRLLKSLYGLKQAPRCWNQKFVQFLKRYGLKVSSADPCLFVSIRESKKLIVALYVDDGLVTGTDTKDIQLFMEELKKEFKIKVGSLNYFLGMEIDQRTDESLFVSQKSYAKKVLERFQMENCNSVATPMELTAKVPEEVTVSNTLEGNDVTAVANATSVKDVATDIPYREAVGSLMYLATATRPDIAHAVSIVSQKLDNPSDGDWKRVKRILRYLKGTVGCGIIYRANHKVGVLEAFCDADYAGDRETRRSTSGVVCKYAGGAVSWMSQKQKSVSLSTTEAEFIAMSEGAKEVIWVKRLLQDITNLQELPVLKVDNASAIKLVKNPEFHKRSKHIEVRHYFVRERYQEGVFDVEHVASKDQLADILTKPLVKERFEKLRRELGLDVSVV